MTKNLHIKLLFIFLFFNTGFRLLAQTEMEIKTSDNYFWGQSIDSTLESAKGFARDDLMYSISKNISKNIKLNSKSDIFVNGIKYISFPRGIKIRVIAFILKSEVKNIRKEPELEVVQMHYKEDSLFKEKNNNTTVNIKENKTVTKQENIKPVENKGINSYKKYNNIIDYIIQSKNINDISDTLQKEKVKGTVMFDSFSKSILYPEKCYLIVFDPFTGAIIAFLDKGTGKTRTNLINNTLIEDFLETYNQMKIVWLQIL